MLLAAGVMLLVSLQYANLYTLLAFAFIVHASCGMAFNIYFTECLGMFPQFAGLSGGLVGGIAFMLSRRDRPEPFSSTGGGTWGRCTRHQSASHLTLAL